MSTWSFSDLLSMLHDKLCYRNDKELQAVKLSSFFDLLNSCLMMQCAISVTSCSLVEVMCVNRSGPLIPHFTDWSENGVTDCRSFE